MAEVKRLFAERNIYLYKCEGNNCSSLLTYYKKFCPDCSFRNHYYSEQYKYPSSELSFALGELDSLLYELSLFKAEPQRYWRQIERDEDHCLREFLREEVKQQIGARNQSEEFIELSSSNEKKKSGGGKRKKS